MTWKSLIVFLGSDQMEKIKSVLKELLVLDGVFLEAFYFHLDLQQEHLWTLMLAYPMW